MAGIYIHIPFCKQACYYCDFHFSTSLKNKEAFIQAFIKEIITRKNYLPANETISTIYFGGGTPSLLSQNEIMQVFEQLHQHFNIDKNAEITLEANPDDLNKAYLTQLAQTPVNRLSIGIQSFFDEDLKWMNRAHNQEQAIESVKTAQDHGFDNITIDLIYGAPTLPNRHWEHNLQQTFDLKIKHLSAYCLTIEPKTVLGNWLSNKKINPVDEQKSICQFEMMLQATKNNGFVQYEISNFCKDNYFSKHNSNYWRGKSYLGLGPSAHSFNGTSRQWNIANNALYIQALEKNKTHYEEELLNPEQRYNEYILTTLRTMWGCDLKKIETEFGNTCSVHCLQQAGGYLQSEHLFLKENVLTLSDKGKLIADKISADLFL